MLRVKKDVTGLEFATLVVKVMSERQTAVDGTAASVHIHIIGGTTGRQAALDGKAASTHSRWPLFH